MEKKTGSYPMGCSFSWEEIKDMRNKKIEFWAADGLNLLRILDIDEKGKSFYMVSQLGKRTWPLKYQKLEEVHNKLHDGKLSLHPYEIDRLIPTWGNYIAGLLKYFNCDKV
jgi:hypothetical protein